MNPAPVEGNHMLSVFIKNILQCSIMCFLNGNMTDKDTVLQKTGIAYSVEKLEILILGWQRDWGAPAKQEELSHILVEPHHITPLCSAAVFNPTHLVQYLVNNGILIDGIFSPRSEAKPLVRALYNGSKDIVRLLVKSGANINICS
ncbi:hypothetical protein BKA66DRAFT_473704 [Pyrenochaeta sp. MPI-SDFR-AT-0127]|nr:hypothetical protein BKA66DRAFT_473704 [Pyrenochaeta sp. MPI-SDFR-AT-0127]